MKQIMANRQIQPHHTSLSSEYRDSSLKIYDLAADSKSLEKYALTIKELNEKLQEMQDKVE